MIKEPDPQLVEREALDRAFDDWYQKEIDIAENDEQRDEIEYWGQKWDDCSPSEPLVYGPEDLWYEDDREAAFAAMENDLAEEINRKWRVLKDINAVWKEETY
jgi:hypothetical protein